VSVVNRTDLKKAVDKQRLEYYERIAQLIRQNPNVALAELRRQHGITYYEMHRAQKLFNLTRKRGRGSSAFRKRTSASS
jgi:hypothetical protein